MATEEQLDELYREHPDGFVAGRNRLVKELRGSGEREEAERIERLRRPSVAAWLINRASLTESALLEEFAAASRELERAQDRALEGKDGGAEELRAAAAREREVIEAIVEAADAGARDAGHPPNRSALELAGQTLRAATADPGLRERVVGGRLERERTAATLGTPDGPPPRGRRASARGRESAKRRERARSQRELERLEAELADATAREERLRTRVDETSGALRREKTKLAEQKRETTALRR
jgi:hypothetical protein